MIVDITASDSTQFAQMRIYGASFTYCVAGWRNSSNWEEAKEYMEHNGMYLWNKMPMCQSRPNLSYQLGLACIEQALNTAAGSRPRGPLDELVAFVQQHNRRDCIINAIAVPAMMACEQYYFTNEERVETVRKTFKSTLPLVAYLSDEEKITLRDMLVMRATSEMYLEHWDHHFAHKEKMRLKTAVKSQVQSSAVAMRKM